ncbi:MAG: DNA primase [Candidatus Kapabacteria bacterium]|nr:DNA primase [Candidatus Kapabacteria bacterium]
MRIPDHIIEQVRAQSNIIDVIGEHVRLKQTGRSYTGLCPFHKEKTPSFHVNPERGIYKCFGCGKAGNVITFMTEYQRLGFVDAVRALATRLGIVIPEDEVQDPTGMGARKDAAFKALREAAEFYSTTLQSSAGNVARIYFAKRGFTDETINTFALGASPAGWDVLMNHLRSNGYTDEHLVDAGLVVVREDGRMYDRFRGRAMFAIHDDVGRVVGFSARVLGDEPDQPKYINSPQSIVFEKSRVLYGLDKAKRAIAAQRRAILVEGQADVVSLHQAGFTTTVASSGTALTRDHLLLLKKYADTVVIVFDADNAGQNATTKGIELALQAGLDPRIVVLPAGTDPDAFVRDNGPEAFAAQLEGNVSCIAFQAARFRQLGELDDAVSQAKAVRFMLMWIAGVPDTIRHPFLVRELAAEFRLNEQVLLRELDQVRSAPRRQDLPGTGYRQTAPQSPAVVVTPPTPTAPSVLAPERELIRVALTNEHGLAILEHKFLVTTQTMVTGAAQRIFQRILITHEEHPDVLQHVVNDTTLTADELREIADIAFGIETPSERWTAFDVELPDRDDERVIRDALLRLRIIKLDALIDELSRSLADMVDQDERERVMYRINQCIIKREDTRRLFQHDSEDLQWLHDDETSASSSSA